MQAHFGQREREEIESQGRWGQQQVYACDECVLAKVGPQDLQTSKNEHTSLLTYCFKLPAPTCCASSTCNDNKKKKNPCSSTQQHLPSKLFTEEPDSKINKSDSSELNPSYTAAFPGSNLFSHSQHTSLWIFNFGRFAPDCTGFPQQIWKRQTVTKW